MILVSVVGGGALFGIAGTLLAVPVVAVAVSVVKELGSKPAAAAVLEDHQMRGVPMRPDLLGRVRVLVRDLVRAALDLREDPARLALEARGDE